MSETRPPLQRDRVVSEAIELYERFIAFVLDIGPPDDRHRRWINSGAVHGRELLRFAPRDGSTPAESTDLIEHWFGILRAWMDDPAAAVADPEAVSTWVSEWPSGLVRELLFTGLRSPDGLDQDAYQLQQLLPAGATIRLEIRPDQVDVAMSAPGVDPIELRRFAGSAQNIHLPLSLALGSLIASLLKRERQAGDTKPN